MHLAVGTDTASHQAALLQRHKARAHGNKEHVVEATAQLGELLGGHFSRQAFELGAQSLTDKRHVGKHLLARLVQKRRRAHVERDGAAACVQSALLQLHVRLLTHEFPFFPQPGAGLALAYKRVAAHAGRRAPTTAHAARHKALLTSRRAS